MHKYLYILLILFVACNNNKIERPKKPENLIKKDMMVDVLYDMSILSAAKSTQKKVMEKNRIDPEVMIFKKYNIDSTQFALSNEYYAYDIDTYEEIYEEVKKKLEAEKVVLDSITSSGAKKRKIPQKKQDSISLKELKMLEDIEEVKTLADVSKGKAKNLIPYSEKISEWYKYTSGSGIEPIVFDNESKGPDGEISMSSVKLDLGGGNTINDRSLIGVKAIPVTTDDYVYSLWLQAKNPSDVGKTIRIRPEIKGGVITIYTLKSKIERVVVSNKIDTELRDTSNFIIEIRGEVTNCDDVEFYLWGVQFEQSSKVSTYTPTWGKKSN